MKIKNLLFIAITFIALQSFGQVAPGRYYVQFTDKNNSPYSLEHPEAFLTQRAIDRRANQGIEYDQRDLPVNPQYLDGVAATGAELINSTKWLNGVMVHTTDPSVIDAINALPYVSNVRAISGETANSTKPFFEKESAGPENKPANLTLKNGLLSFDYGYAYDQINLINGIPLHEAGYRGEGMVIAVIDAGFDQVDTDLLFDSLRNDGRILGTKDFVTPGGNVYTAHYHGRMVLSTMAANIPGLMIGTAPKASYWLLRSENAPQEYVDEEYNWVSAAEFADSVGADVINSSLGYTEFDDPSQNHTYADMDGNTTVVTRGADIAATKGILVVNSAGNSGTNSWFYIGAPADGDSVFTIGAVDNSGYYVDFSSKGPTYDGRIKPNVVATGQGTTVSDGYDGVTFGSGTSFSSPIIAGMSACLWQAMPGKTNMEIQDAIMHSASQYFNPDSLLGYGIPNYQSAWWILTSVDSNTGNNDEFVKVYPNPFNNYVYLKFTDMQTNYVDVKLINMLGEVIYNQTITSPIYKLSFDGLSDKMPAGFYFLQLSEKQKVQTVKLIKR
jgi:hypothetical protein